MEVLPAKAVMSHVSCPWIQLKLKTENISEHLMLVQRGQDMDADSAGQGAKPLQCSTDGWSMPGVKLSVKRGEQHKMETDSEGRGAGSSPRPTPISRSRTRDQQACSNGRWRAWRGQSMGQRVTMIRPA